MTEPSYHPSNVDLDLWTSHLVGGRLVWFSKTAADTRNKHASLGLMPVVQVETVSSLGLFDS